MEPVTGTEAGLELLSVVAAWGGLRIALAGASLSISLVRLALSRGA